MPHTQSQLPLVNRPRSSLNRKVEYIAPSAEIIDRFAFSVCQKLGNKTQGNFTDTDTVRFLSNFLKTVVKITARYMNEETLYDQQKGR